MPVAVAKEKVSSRNEKCTNKSTRFLYGSQLVTQRATKSEVKFAMEKYRFEKLKFHFKNSSCDD